jgi:acetolactate synthase-1/2/3 large subunit
VAEFRDMLKNCIATPGVHLIDLEIDYSDNDRVLNKEIRELSSKL